jgi:hypothetical protein
MRSGLHYRVTNRDRSSQRCTTRGRDPLQRVDRVVPPRGVVASGRPTPGLEEPTPIRRSAATGSMPGRRRLGGAANVSRRTLASTRRPRSPAGDAPHPCALTSL